MKNFNQIKKGGFKLEPCIYAKTIKEIECYLYYKKQIAEILEKESKGLATDRDLSKRAMMQYYVKVIDSAEKYIPLDYRAAIKEHLIEGSGYEYLERKYYVTTSSMKRYTQAFVWAVSKELGEDF